MFARFDENPAMTLRVIKETKRYGRTDGRTYGRTDGQRENSIPLQTKFAGGIIIILIIIIVVRMGALMALWSRFYYSVVYRLHSDIVSMVYCLYPV